MSLTLIVAADEADAIGRGNDLPWHIPADLRRFRALTTGHAVILGRATHRSIKQRLGRSLPGRHSVVLTRAPPAEPEADVTYTSRLQNALACADAWREARGQSRFFVAGGASVYEQCLPLARSIFLTRVSGVHDCDTSMPDGWLRNFALRHSTRHRCDPPGPRFSFDYYERP